MKSIYITCNKLRQRDNDMILENIVGIGTGKLTVVALFISNISI